MKRYIRFIVLLTGFAFTSIASALDLIQAYELAKKTDPTIAAAIDQYDAAKEKSPQAISSLLPTIGASGGYTHSSTDVNSPASSYDRNNDQRSWSLKLSQPIINVQNWINYSQAKLTVMQAEATLFDAKQNLIIRVAEAYFDVSMAIQTLEFTRQQKAAIAEQLEAAKLRFEVGAATITDAKEAQASYDSILAEEIRVVANLDIKRYTLEQLIGQPFDEINLIRNNFVFPTPTPNLDTYWIDAAKQSAWSVVYANLGRQIADKQIGYARAGHYPTLDLVASRSGDRADAPIGYTGNAYTHTSQIGLQLNIPIFQGGYVNSKVREAEALSKKSVNDFLSAQRDASIFAKQGYLSVISGQSEVAALEQALISDQAALDANKLGYEVGVRVNIDVLDAQAKLYSTRQNLAQAKVNLLLAQLNLKASVGDLIEPDLTFINTFLDANLSSASDDPK